jgi:hypothetical protein
VPELRQLSTWRKGTKHVRVVRGMAPQKNFFRFDFTPSFSLADIGYS